MERIVFAHGLGQSPSSWNSVISRMKEKKSDFSPMPLSLFAMLEGQSPTYENLYGAFAKCLGNIDGAFHLCGISLGGILSLNYTIDFPKKVMSLALIGTPPKTPRALFLLQNVIFALLPKSFFSSIDKSLGKDGVLSFLSSMKGLNFSEGAKGISCPVLIACGESDRANIKSVRHLNKNIGGSTLKVIKGAGHDVCKDSPERLADALLEFFV